MSARPAKSSATRQAFEQGLEHVWSQAAASLPGGDWTRQVRAEALARVVLSGLPGRRDEQWKYADLANRRTTALPLAEPVRAPVQSNAAVPVDAHHVGLANGRLTQVPAAGSLPDGFEVLRLADTLEIPSLWLRPFLEPSGSAIDNLNLAFATDGILVRVGRGVAVARPLVVQNSISLSGTMSHDRSAIVLEEEARLTLIEITDADATRDALAISRLAITLGRGASLMHIRLSCGTQGAVLIQDGSVELAAGARYGHVALARGAGLLRQQASVRLAGEGAQCDLACAYAAPAGHQVDLSITLHHAAPRTTSRLLAKGIAARKGRGAVQGKVVVDEVAQGTDSHQMARGLLLEEGAEIFHKPELEIYADDVKCGHGATIASLDPTQMFYLQSRGIPAVQARDMLLEAFVQQVTDHAPDALRDNLEAWARRNLLQKEGSA